MDKLLTVPEVAELLNCHRITVYRWIREGRLPAIRSAPRMVRIAQEDLQAFLDEHKNTKDPHQERMKLFAVQDRTRTTE